MRLSLCITELRIELASIRRSLAGSELAKAKGNLREREWEQWYHRCAEAQQQGRLSQFWKENEEEE